MVGVEEVPEWKRRQREAERASKRGFVLDTKKVKQGEVFKDHRGQRYFIDKNGSWRKVDQVRAAENVTASKTP